MRIGIDATALPSQPVGAGIYILNLIRFLAGIPSEHQLVVFVQKKKRKLFNLPDSDSIEWVEVDDMHPSTRLIWEQTFFPWLVRKARLDLLHSLHYTCPIALSCVSIVTFHDMTFFLHPELHTLIKRYYFPMVMRYSARHSNGIIAVSKNTHQDIIRLMGISSEKVFTVPLGVDKDFQPYSDADLLSGFRKKHHFPEKFILFVGTIEPRKNLPLLLRAYHRLAQDDVVHDLVIVGRYGWMYQEVLEQIESLKLQSRVHFTGYLSLQDMPLVYNLASLFVYPSLYEGFGLPPLEAMACGVPVITSAISAMQEVVGEAGLLFQLHDELELYQKIRLALSDSKLRNELVNRGLQRAAQYTWEKTARLTLDVYQHVLLQQ